jgi:autotransporter-associated beta strand protein
VADGSADVDAVVSGAIASYDGVSSRTFIKSGNGTVALTGDNTWLSANASSTFAINAGKVQIGIGGTAGSLGGTAVITNNGTLAFNRSDAISFTNTINGTGNVIQAGTGTTTLGAANGYSGTTSINSGALRATNATSLGSTAAGTTVSSGAALELSGSISIGAEALSLAGTGISSGGALRSVSGVNAYTGEITLASASRINTDAGSLTLSGNTTGSNTNLSLGGEGDTVVTGGLSLGSGALTKDGGGTVTLNGSISYSGATALNAGKLVINGSNANSAITIASGATLGGAGTVGAVTVNSGGFIAPGNSPGTLTVGDLTLNGGGGVNHVLGSGLLLSAQDRGPFGLPFGLAHALRGLHGLSRTAHKITDAGASAEGTGEAVKVLAILGQVQHHLDLVAIDGPGRYHLGQVRVVAIVSGMVDAGGLLPLLKQKQQG